MCSNCFGWCSSWCKPGISSLLVLPQAGISKIKTHMKIQQEDIEVIILEVWHSVASSWPLSASSSFCMRFLLPKPQKIPTVVSPNGNHSAHACAAYALPISSNALTQVPMFSFIYQASHTVLRLSKWSKPKLATLLPQELWQSCKSY